MARPVFQKKTKQSTRASPFRYKLYKKYLYVSWTDRNFGMQKSKTAESNGLQCLDILESTTAETNGLQCLDILGPSPGNKRVVDQSIIDAIGTETSDSENDCDALPVPSLFKPRGGSAGLLRSRSLGCLTLVVQGGNFIDRVDPYFQSSTIVVDHKAQSQPVSGTGMTRSASMSSFQKSRSEYNRAVGESLSNSPKKLAGCTEHDIALIDHLMSDL